LEGLGWRILRIWSTDWWTNAERECNRLHTALLALAKERKQTASPDLGNPPASGDEQYEDKSASEEDAEAEAVDLSRVSQEPAREMTNERGHPEASRFYENEYRETLRAIVRDEIAKWGPIRLDRLAQKVARLHGFQRTGREIQDRVSASIPSDYGRTQEDLGVFVWPRGADPSTLDAFRHSAGGEARDPSEIPMEELVALARECSVEQDDQDTVLLAMRNACGLHKLREASRDRFLKAIATI
jgi:hypothetical protein